MKTNRPGASGLFKTAAILLGAALPCLGGGSIDNSFFQQGKIDDAIYAVAVDSFTNIIIAGNFAHVYGTNASGLAVLNPDGSFKAAPNSDFVRGCQAVAVDSLDRIYAGGSDRYCRFIPYEGSWTLDTSFGAPTYTGNIPLEYITAMAIRPLDDMQYVIADGALYNFDVFGVSQNNAPSTLVNGGIIKVTYAPPVAVGDVSYLEHLLVCGSFGVAQVSADGQLLAGPFAGYETFTCAAERTPVATAACSSIFGDIVGAGFLGAVNAYNNDLPTEEGLWVNRLGGLPNAPAYFRNINSNTNHAQDVGYSAGAMIAFDGGDVVLGGDFSKIGGVSVQNLAHINPNGEVDPTFPGVGYTVTAIAQQPDGKYIVVGFDEYLPLTGEVLRMTITEPTPVAAAITQNSMDVTVLEGDDACIVAGYTGTPPPVATWDDNGTPVPGSGGSEICFSAAYATNAGSYNLVLTPFCGNTLSSTAAQLTVIPVAPPVNDSFSSAIVLSGPSASSSSSLRSSTVQSGERDPTGYADGHSVWWTWTAPVTGLATVSVAGSDGTPTMSIYSGTAFDALEDITNNVTYYCYIDPDGGEMECRFSGFATAVTFPVTNGVTYQIQVGGALVTGSMDDVDLTLTTQAILTPPPNAWTLVSPPPTTNDLYCVAAGNGTIVAAGENAVPVTSADGVNWMMEDSGLDPSNEIWGLAYGNGVFAAVGTYGFTSVSPDGVNWTPGSANILPGDYLWGVTFAQGMFVAVGDDGTVVTSPDGMSWTTQTNGAAVSPSDSLYSVAFGNGQFVAVGDDDSIVTSPNGTNWVEQHSGLTNNLTLGPVAAGDGVFVVIDSSNGELASSDGVNWSAPSGGLPDYSAAVAFGHGHFVGCDYNNDIFTSLDGLNWLTDLSPIVGFGDELDAATYYQNGEFVLVGEQGLILDSWPDQIPGVAVTTATGIQFVVTGLTGTTVVIDSAMQLNPPNWMPISTNTIVNGSLLFTDSASLPAGFYRVVYQ